MLLLLLASVSGSAQWIAGLAVSGFAWRRHRSAGLKLSLAALAGLTALEIIAGSVFTLLIPPIINEGFSAGTVGLMLNPNPPMDPDGGREDSGRGGRELQAR